MIQLIPYIFVPTYNHQPQSQSNQIDFHRWIDKSEIILSFFLHVIDLRDDTTQIEKKCGPVFKCITILLLKGNSVLWTCLHTNVCIIIIDVLKWREFRLFEQNYLFETFEWENFAFCASSFKLFTFRSSYILGPWELGSLQYIRLLLGWGLGLVPGPP